MTTTTNYETLIKIQKEFPELTFDNNGYEYLDKEVKERHKEQIDLISEILKKEINGFVRFDNFKPRKNGTFDVRVQYYWDINFKGVGYFNIEDFKEYEGDK